VTWGVAATIVHRDRLAVPASPPAAPGHGAVLAAADPAQALVLSLALLVIHAMGPEGVAPFIYFQF
jgi:hypothetical protein